MKLIHPDIYYLVKFNNYQQKMTSEGDRFYDKAEKNISGCFECFYNFPKAFILYNAAGIAYTTEGKNAKAAQSYKNGITIYENNFNDDEKQQYKDDYNKMMKLNYVLANSMFYQSRNNNNISRNNNVLYDNNIPRHHTYYSPQNNTHDDENIK